MQVPILSGIFPESSADFTRSFPVNLYPMAEPGDTTGTGISKGYLKLTPGLKKMADTTAADRGGTLWNGTHYRVIGMSLVAVLADGSTTSIGSVGGIEPVTFAQSFDLLAIASGGALFYYDGAALTQVTDPDLGTALSVVWQDGYFITTDGTSIVVTELNDPYNINPTKYGSSEADPDPVVGLLSLRGELYALNRYTIEVFSNQGSTGFPFSRQRGAQIPKGCVNARAFCPFVETFAFCGSGHNEAPAIYLAGAGQGIPISPNPLNDALAGLSPADLATVELESRNGAGRTELLVHLPTGSWVYHWTASQQFDLPVWSRLAGGADLARAYPGRHFTLIGTDWWCGSASAIGVVDDDEPTLFGAPLAYQFDTALVYNEGQAAIVHSLELVTLGGRGPVGAISLSYTDDGATWSQERATRIGGPGDRAIRPAWRRLGRIRHWRGFRFRGFATAPVAFARLEAEMEPLSG